MKIAYNDCFGEFGLSTKGVLLGRKLSGNNKWGGVSIIGDKCPGEEAITYNCDACFDHSEREDETLIQVIEALGIEANGEHADLHIEEIPDGSIYEIEDSHGYEEVVPPREKGWKNDASKYKIYKDFYNKNVIAIEQYKSLRKNFSKLTTAVLGSNYYNMAMDVYDSDKCVCEDIIAKLNKTSRISKLLKRIGVIWKTYL